MFMDIAHSFFVLYFMSMHCNCCTIALFSHLGYYFIKHTSHNQENHKHCSVWVFWKWSPRHG